MFIAEELICHILTIPKEMQKHYPSEFMFLPIEQKQSISGEIVCHVILLVPECFSQQLQ